MINVETIPLFAGPSLAFEDISKISIPERIF